MALFKALQYSLLFLRFLPMICRVPCLTYERLAMSDRPFAFMNAATWQGILGTPSFRCPESKEKYGISIQFSAVSGDIVKYGYCLQQTLKVNIYPRLANILYNQRSQFC